MKRRTNRKFTIIFQIDIRYSPAIAMGPKCYFFPFSLSGWVSHSNLSVT